MAICENCNFYFRIPADADDYAQGKGDCVTEKKDEKGTYWLSTPVFDTTGACNKFHKKQV